MDLLVSNSVLPKIFSYLEPPDVMRCRRVSRQFNEIIERDRHNMKQDTISMFIFRDFNGLNIDWCDSENASISTAIIVDKELEFRSQGPRTRAIVNSFAYHRRPQTLDFEGYFAALRTSAQVLERPNKFRILNTTAGLSEIVQLTLKWFCKLRVVLGDASPTSNAIVIPYRRIEIEMMLDCHWNIRLEVLELRRTGNWDAVVALSRKIDSAELRIFCEMPITKSILHFDTSRKILIACKDVDVQLLKQFLQEWISGVREIRELAFMIVGENESRLKELRSAIDELKPLCDIHDNSSEDIEIQLKIYSKHSPKYLCVFCESVVINFVTFG